MKHFIRFISFLCIALVSLSLFSCGETPAQKFLREYEAFVVSAEKSAEKKAVGKIESLSKKEEVFVKKTGELAKKTELWTASDAAEFAKLKARFVAAESKLAAQKVANEAKKVFGSKK